MIDASPNTQELAEIITTVFAIGSGVLLVYCLRNSFGLLRDALMGTSSFMTDDEHYHNAYQNYQGSSFEDFEKNYSRDKTY